MASKRTRPATSSGEMSPAAASAQALKVRVGAGKVYVGARVSPSAARVALRGIYGDKLKVSLTAPPEDNRANQQLEEALAGWLALPTRHVRVDAGHGSRDKVVAFAGIEEAELRKRLGTLLQRVCPGSQEDTGG
jgi:uncharacterized protein YggU (UPF0235/DUF167 family)